MEFRTSNEKINTKSDGKTNQKTYKKIKLKRNVGFISATSFVVGASIGSGIFISPKGVLQETGSVGMCLFVWAAAGVLSLFGAMSFAELGCLVPKSGGEYHYLKVGSGRIVAFMFAWTNALILIPSIVAITCLTLANYVVTMFDFCGTPQILVKLIAAIVIITLCITNCWDTKLVAAMQVFFSATKMIALAIIIVGGIVCLVKGKVATLQTGFSGTTGSASSIALAFYNALFTYDGWKILSFITEEIENPSRTLPRANITGVIVATVVIVLVNISYLTVLGTQGLLASPVVAMTWGEEVFDSGGIIMAIFVVFSSFGSANAAMFSGTRPLYAAARDKQFPEVLSYVSIRRYTPIPCVIFTTIVSIFMLIPGDIRSLINLFSFAVWMFYFLTILSLFVLRRTMKDAERKIKVFLLLPSVFMVWSAYLVIAPIVQDPSIEFLYAFVSIIGSLVVYIPFVHFKVDCTYFEPISRFIQCWMQVVPSPYDPEH